MNPIKQKSNVKNQQSYQVSGVLAENKQREGCLETPKIQRKRQYVTNLTDTLNIVFCLNIIWSNKVRMEIVDFYHLLTMSYLKRQRPCKNQAVVYISS